MPNPRALKISSVIETLTKYRDSHGDIPMMIEVPREGVLYITKLGIDSFEEDEGTIAIFDVEVEDDA